VTSRDHVTSPANDGWPPVLPVMLGFPASKYTQRHRCYYCVHWILVLCLAYQSEQQQCSFCQRTGKPEGHNNTTTWITGKCIEKQHDTRNHRFALQQSHVHYDMRKFNFSNRIIQIWNSLPDYVVASPTINTFKARLYKFWENQDVRYNCKADISFTRSCSKVEFTID